MRTFLVFAVIALYIAVAFVPPSSQNLQAAMLQLNESKLFTGLHVGAASAGEKLDLAATAGLLKDLAAKVSTTSPKELVNGTTGKEYAEKITQAATVIAAMGGKTPDELQVDLRNELAKKAAEAIQNIGKGQPAGSLVWKRMLKNETDPTVLGQLQLIQEAIKSGDVRKCGELPYAAPVERTVDGTMYMTPSRGDYLAYCLARVNGEGTRCDQIDDRISPALQTACRADFGSDV
ncbi:MAG TPA: hypothetical protein PKV72_06050 [Candidatus Peribacteria bacterium]|nr:hypothetical protein [Candidatus Peribacteria bacterium]